MPEQNKDPLANYRSAPSPLYRVWQFARKVLIAAFITTLVALTIALLWVGSEVFLLIFAGVLLAILIRSASGVLTRYFPLSNGVAVTAVLIGSIGIVALGTWLLADSVQQQFQELSEQLPVVYEQLRTKVSQYPLGRSIADRVPSPEQFLMGRRSPQLFGRVTGIFSTVLNVLTNILIVLMTALYFAYDPGRYRDGVIYLTPRSYEDRAREVLKTIETTLRRFLLGISVSMVINGSLTGIGLWIFDIPFAIPLGIIAGLMTFIPNIGPLIAAIPALLIALSQGPSNALYVFLLYLFVQNLDGFVITPLIQQQAVSLPPALVIMSQLLLAVTFGFLGLLVAVPLFAALFVMVKMTYVEDALGRWDVEVKGEAEAIREVEKQ